MPRFSVLTFALAAFGASARAQQPVDTTQLDSIIRRAIAEKHIIGLSVGVMFAEAVRLVIFAGLLWGAGDLGILWVKSHHDIRATRILTARIASMIQHIGEATGSLRSTGGVSPDNET